MKNKRLKRILILAVLALAVLVLHMRWDDIVQKPLVPESENYVLAKQHDDYAEYVLSTFHHVRDELMFYHYFQDKELVKAGFTSLRPWVYKLVIVPEPSWGLTGSATSSPSYNSDEGCVIYVYEDCLEIDGVTYLFPEEDEQGSVLDFFDKSWDLFRYHTEDGYSRQGVYTGRVYPGEPQEDNMPTRYYPEE